MHVKVECFLNFCLQSEIKIVFSPKVQFKCDAEIDPFDFPDEVASESFSNSKNEFSKGQLASL